MTIHAVVVNHNTSAWTELLVRSLFAANPGQSIDLTIMDNASTDDMTGLTVAAAQYQVPILQSGFTTQTMNNSHGEVLRTFVLAQERALASHFLFLDTDVCFTQPHVIAQLCDLLDSDDTLFGVGPRMSWDGETEPPEVRDNPSVYANRLHPCCALVRNTDFFRTVVREIGLSCVNYLWADQTQYLDTFRLMTMTMRTHGLRHAITDALIMHSFAVSYPNDWESLLPMKEQHRDRWLAHYREVASSPAGTP